MTRSVVQLLIMVDGEVRTWGSGSVISQDGLILTNAHVATPEYAVDEIVVAVTGDSDQPPERAYRAEVRAADPALDLAIVQVTEALGGGPYEAGTIPPLPIGNSSETHIGDDLLIFGYPAIGGQTITFTRGLVSGFNSDAIIGDRAWIKTDATITGGNSGGTAASRDGELIGVPTNMAPPDCRPMRDTDRDGDIDADDVCIPLGGFLNGVRPINAAADMIEAVTQGVAYVPIGTEVGPPEDFSTEDVVFSRPLFVDQIPAGEPTGGFWVPSGTTLLCAWWTYEGMADGARWDAVWTHNGEVSEDFSSIGDIWNGGQQGEWWTCSVDDTPIEEGIWDLALHVEGERINGSFVGVGDAMTPVEVTFTNRSESQSVCWLFLSPRVTSFWGDDLLGGDDVLRPGESRTFNLPPATYDVRAEDCARLVLLEVTQEVKGPVELFYE